MNRIEKTILDNRSRNQHSIMAYLNCGDPSIEMTFELIMQCASQNVDIIELGVPFDNSFTDGGTVLRSHERAIKNNVTFEDALRLVKKVRAEHKIPIVLLIDFSYSIKQRGIKYVVEQSSISGVDGLLFHGLPPLYQEEYIKQTDIYNIEPIFSLYPNTSPEMIEKTLRNAKGFIYLVTQYGRTGAPVNFLSKKIISFYSSIHNATNLPLMAGFGIKNLKDIMNIFSSNTIDGVIIGSAICNIIEAGLPDNQHIKDALSDYLKIITVAKKTSYRSS